MGMEKTSGLATGNGLSPWEAIQLVAAGHGSLSDYGLADNYENAKKVDEMKAGMKKIADRGLVYDIVS